MDKKLSYEELEQRVKELEEEAVERKQAEEALRQSEKKYSTLVENSLTGIYIDQNGKIVFANDKFVQIYKYPRDELIGIESWKLVHPEDRVLTDERRKKRLKGEEVPSEYDARGLTKDGETIWVKRRNTRIEYNRNPAILGNIVDITERKKAEEEKKDLEAQLLQAQKMEAIGTLAGGIAQDINNLLAAIQGNVDLTLMKINEKHPLYGRFKSIEEQVKRGATLTKQLLGYARGGKYDVRPTNLNQLVSETLETFGGTRKEISIYRELAEDLFEIKADQSQIEQVLLNLYMNAADAMPKGGDLFLKTMNVTHKDIVSKIPNPKPGEYVLLIVEDTGTGMDKETTERIFDPFFTTNKMGRGTGLGLAATYGIIKNHSGYIDVNSEKGKGTTFNIYLPKSEKKS